MEEIEDLVKMSKMDNADCEQLIIDAFNRGLVAGKILTKLKIIEAIQEEK